jgi:hypothetical protein
MTQLQTAIVAWAADHVGVKEDPPGSNSGPEIDGWLMLMHGTPGQPWCAAFACCAVLAAADEVGVTVPGFHKHLGTQQLWMTNIPLQVQSPQPGDIYVLRHTAGTGHCGIVETVDEDGTVKSEISGNTWGGTLGGREGDQVARHVGPPEKTHSGVLLGYIRVG